VCEREAVEGARHAILRECVCLCVRVRGPANPNEGFRRQLENYENSLKAIGFSSIPPHFDTYIIHQASNTPIIYAHTSAHAHTRGRADSQKTRESETKRSGQMCACLHVCVPVCDTYLFAFPFPYARAPTHPATQSRTCLLTFTLTPTLTLKLTVHSLTH
jgi:hypothetical protein